MWLIKNKKILFATVILIGTKVGVGIFGIPISFSKAGFFIGLAILIFVWLITLLVDLMYGEVVLRTEKKHQLVGYTGIYLNSIWKNIVLFADALSIYAALLAYTIISGEFLIDLISPITYIEPTVLSFIFFTVVSVLIILGLKKIAWLELGIAGLFILVMLFITIVGIPHLNFTNLLTVNSSEWFLPYGVLLFAFAGISAIPIQREILGSQEEKLRKSIWYAGIFIGILYIIFAFITVGISGENTSPNAIAGLQEILGFKVVFLGSLFGILAVSTAFVMLGSALFEMFIYDYGIKRISAWLLVILPPLALFLAGLRTFVDIISLGGTIGLAPIFVAIMLIYIKSKNKGTRVPEYSIQVPVWMIYSLMLILLVGVGFALAFR